ncbi:MAG TPA: DUF3368 domain-containing protein [Pricia sp.]|nr:DUF3368 domain-containing protein [Pricia sp.]
MAKKIGLKIMGILGVLVRAKENRIIQIVKPLIEKLELNDFRISAKLKTQILRRTREA